MPLNRKRLLRYSLIAVLAGALVVAFTPLLVVGGLRAWLWWQARQQKVTLEVESIEAPYLRPVVMHRVHMASAPDAAFRIEVTAAQVTLELNLQSILLRTRGRALRTLSIESMRAELHRNASGRSVSEPGWNALQKSLPNNFRLDRADVRVEDGPTVIMLRDLSLNASDTEAGHFGAAEVMISSPLFRQTFSALRGSTTWQDDRLTVAGLSLSRGLDVQSIAVDLAHLSKQRVGLEFDVDVFGGKIRTNVSNEWHSNPPTWNLVGSATDISLAQTSEGLGFTDRVNGMVHACKVTFRGDPHDPTHATASLWTELTGLSWRNRAADVIMLGAALYNRQVQLQQLYVKQSNNQLTLSGEGSLPSKSSDWLNPDFRGTISGSINDLGAFASLFGAAPDEFAGTVAIDGTLNARDRKIGGHVMASANSLSIFQRQIDSFTANVNLRAQDLEIEQLDLRRKQDWLHVEGRIDLGNEHTYSGSLSADMKNLSDYLSIFGVTDPADSNPASMYMQFTIDSGVWSGNAAMTTAASRCAVEITSLPLRIGEDWNELSMTPLDVALAFGPMLDLDKGPRWLGLGILRGGILNGGIRLTGTLQHPNLDGDVQLIDGKMKNENLGFDGVSAYLRLGGSHGLIDFLHLNSKDVDLLFRGEMEVGDTDDVTITLAGASPLFDASSYPLDCVSRVTVSPIDTMLAPVISGIEFRGGLFTRSWTVALQPTAPKLLGPVNLSTRIIPLCPGKSSAGTTLTIGAYSPRQPPARPRKRSRHR